MRKLRASERSKKSRESDGHVVVVTEAYIGWGCWRRWWWWTDRLWEVEGVEGLDVAYIDQAIDSVPEGM